MVNHESHLAMHFPHFLATVQSSPAVSPSSLQSCIVNASQIIHISCGIKHFTYGIYSSTVVFYNLKATSGSDCIFFVRYKGFHHNSHYLIKDLFQFFCIHDYCIHVCLYFIEYLILPYQATLGRHIDSLSAEIEFDCQYVMNEINQLLTVMYSHQVDMQLEENHWRVEVGRTALLLDGD